MVKSHEGSFCQNDFIRSEQQTVIIRICNVFCFDISSNILKLSSRLVSYSGIIYFMYFIYNVNIWAMWEIYDAYIKPSLKALLSVWQQPNGEWSVSFFNQRQKILLMMLYTNRISDANERSKAFFICNVCFLLYVEIDRWNVWTDDVT